MHTYSPLRGAGAQMMGTARQWGLAIACALCLLPPALASGELSTFVVRYRDDAVPASVSALPTERLANLQAALGSAFAVAGRTRDGAFRLQLAQPVDLEGSRAALNRVRLDPAVLYANAEPGAAPQPSTGPPTDRLIVKYRDPALIAHARANLPVDRGRLAQLSTLANLPVAWVRGMHDGANVLRMPRPLPVAQVEAIAARIAQEPDVEYAQPDHIVTARRVPSDPCYAATGVRPCVGGYQWNLFDPVSGINAPAAWDITTGSVDVNVAVLDTGALFDHPDLQGRYAGGYDMISDCAVANDGQPGPCTWSGASPPEMVPDLFSRDADAADAGTWVSSVENSGSDVPPFHRFVGCRVQNSTWHGAHVAGIVGARPDNGRGIAGINWIGGIVPVRVLGKCEGLESDVADAMVWAAGGHVPGVPANANPARVLNLSLGHEASCPPATQNAVNVALELGAVVVVAAGNDNYDASRDTPGNCNGVVVVAATDQSGLKASYSNHGTTVTLAAPGGGDGATDTQILSTVNSGTTTPVPSGHNFGGKSGTSMAAPHVTGVASLMLSVNPALTPAQVIALLQSSARAFPASGIACDLPNPRRAACNCTTALCGSGILDAGAAVAAAVPARGITLGSASNPAYAGAALTLTAIVTLPAIDPLGVVEFGNGGTPIPGCADISLVGTGNIRSAVCVTADLPVGTHELTAAYRGGSAVQGPQVPPLVSAPLFQVIQSLPQASQTQLTSAPNPSLLGANADLAATVSGLHPTGTVQFKSGFGTQVIAGCEAVPLIGSGDSRVAVCTTDGLPVGDHFIVAYYGGDAYNPASASGFLTHTVVAPCVSTPRSRCP